MTGASKFFPPAKKQATLPLALPEEKLYSLERFYCGSENRLALDTAKAFISSRMHNVLVIAGKPKSGKSHLLKGIYHGWRGKKKAAFIDLKTLTKADSKSVGATFRLAAEAGLVCIDDLDDHAVNKKTLDNIFFLFNSLVNNNACLAVAMKTSPAKCPQLPDYLSSRLLSGMVITLKKPDETEKKRILVKIAADKSITLTPNAAQYILEHSSRSVGDLLTFIDQLESNLTPEQKRIGLQLLKRVINSISV